MLTNAQEKLIRSLHKKKYRKHLGLCLVEGQKFVDEAKEYLDLTFTDEDTKHFEKLMTTETPQTIAGIARIPKWTTSDIKECDQIIILDGLQDPGNVGTIIRGALAFNTGIILIESADPTSPKVIRSSAGSIFHIPWIEVGRDIAGDVIRELQRPILRLEKTENSHSLSAIKNDKYAIIIGSEGSGIQLQVDGQSVMIEHNPKLESLNAAMAATIALYHLSG